MPESNNDLCAELGGMYCIIQYKFRAALTIVYCTLSVDLQIIVKMNKLII